ncbi:MAG: sugar phosphate isomerase/epimerase [Kiritimatiellae bacterium]|nr:sugar phosphate isomerase/epimerase [Kiritimatiellia bacterium]
MIDRRSFFGLGALAAFAAGCNTVTSRSCRAAGRKVQFKFGMAGFSCHLMTVDETLAFMKKLDMHYLCIKDFHLPMKSTQAEIDAFKRKCADFDVTGYGVGPIYMGSDDECKRAFDYAKAIGVKTVVAVPFEKKEKKRMHSRARCEFLSGLCAKYDLRVAIHNHGPDIPDCYPTGESSFNMVKDLDPRMGLCLDIGHDYRAKANPADSVRRFHTRLFDMHVKNILLKPKYHAVPMPRGEMDLWEVVNALVDVGYAGCCSLEYESFPRKGSKPGIKEMDVAECVGYFKGLMKAAEG